MQAPSAWPEHEAPGDWPQHESSDYWPESARAPLGPDHWPDDSEPAEWAAPAHESTTLGPDLWPTDDDDPDSWSRPSQALRPPDSTTPPAEEESDAPGAGAGIMPSMSVFTEVSSALSAEAESERRWHALQKSRAVVDKPSHSIRNVAIIGLLLISAFAGFLVLQRGASEPVISSTTPVDKLPWRDANAPSGKFRLQMPTTSTATQFTLAGMEGELMVAKFPNGEVRAASFAINQTIGNQTAFLQSILAERAEQLFGAIQTIPIKVRWGLAIDGTMDLGSKAIAIRASMVGSTVYLVEAESTGTSDRHTALFERACATFVPTETN